MSNDTVYLIVKSVSRDTVYLVVKSVSHDMTFSAPDLCSMNLQSRTVSAADTSSGSEIRVSQHGSTTSTTCVVTYDLFGATMYWQDNVSGE